MTDHIIAISQLKQVIEKIERLENEKANIIEDIQTTYTEAKSQGFDLPTIKKVIKIRKMDRDKFQQQEALLDTYLDALGI